MFSLLFDTVFPILGEFFGGLSAVATAPTYTALAWIFSQVDPSLTCVNVFNGAVFSLSPPLLDVGFLGWLISFISDPLYGVMIIWCNWLGVGSLPFWGGLLILLVSSFMIIFLVRFFISLVK